MNDNIILISGLGNLYVYYMTYTTDSWTLTLK